MKTKIIIYLLILTIGWLIGEYPHIPSFHFSFISHEQPDITVVDKCVSITLLAFALVLFFVFFHNFWVMVIMLFFVCGFIGNALDEFSHKESILTMNEKISLFLALLTSSILIWIHHRKSITKSAK